MNARGGFDEPASQVGDRLPESAASPVGASAAPDRSSRARILDACRYCGRPAHLRRTLLIALIVGSVLTAINQLDVILRGDATTATAVKCGLNYVVPFVVSNLGLLTGRQRREHPNQ